MDALHIEQGEPMYRQEASVGLFQVMFPYYTMAAPMLRYVPVNFGELWLYYKQGYFTAGYYTKNLERVATAVLNACKDGVPAAWEQEWTRLDRELTAASYALVGVDITALSTEELQGLYDRIYQLDIDMWALSIFIDAFDAGFDRKDTERIAALHGFTEEEIHALSTPVEPSFMTSWDIALQRVADGLLTREALAQEFYWYGVSYSDVAEVDAPFIDAALAERHPVSFTSPIEAEKVILSQHNLFSNPLELFRKLTAWRDERKRLNYVGLYGLVKITREMLQRYNCDPAYANALLPTQIHDLLGGTFTPDDLRRQYEDGVFIHLTPEGQFEYHFGADAQKLWSSVEQAFTASQAAHQTEELKGTIASKGKVQGRVQVLMNFNDPRAAEFQKGDILVTSMTRPEFLPLMKLAGAIVTNEGGITSHAAIVSREFRIPCIIGTHVATQVLKTGDMVEVDADRGVVRILS